MKQFNRGILTLFSLALMLSIGIKAVAQPGSAPAFQTHEVDKDNKVTLRISAPNAKDVKVTTQMLKGAQPLTKGANGVWSITFGPVKPDMYPYAFIVDGVQVADPANSMIFPNEGFQNSIMEVPGPTPLVHAVKNVPHGTVSYRYYTSKELGTRPVVVYTPPGYEQNPNKKYPVLYLLHGTTDTEETWTKVGRANFILDNLIADSKATPMIIVMPYGRAYPVISKSSGSLRNKENLAEFKKDFMGNLMPFIEKNYRTINLPTGRAIAGFSGGGGTSLYFGLNNPNLFSWVCGFAPGMLKNEFEANNEVIFKNPAAANKNLKLFWMAVGKEDSLNGVIKDYMKVLDEKKIKYEFMESEGGHTWMNCKLYLSTIGQKLFK